jgi:acetoin utilization protein AcuB
MTKPIPTIQKFMTTTPFTITGEQPLTEAVKLMEEHSIRHLPVVNDGKIVGILSESDLRLMLTFKGADFTQEKVKQAMTLSPIIVNIETRLDEVCLEMAEKKIGSVLIQDNHKLVGIFTWIDALKAMDELMKTRLK